MPMPKNMNVYGDAMAFMDKVLEKGKVIVDYDDHGAAMYFRQKCYEFRKKFQDFRRTDDLIGMEEYGTSYYDDIKLVVEGALVVGSVRKKPQAYEELPDGTLVPLNLYDGTATEPEVARVRAPEEDLTLDLTQFGLDNGAEGE